MEIPSEIDIEKRMLKRYINLKKTSTSYGNVIQCDLRFFFERIAMLFLQEQIFYNLD